MVLSGSKSATTTSSRMRRYNPGAEFHYSFDANRTFSREGKRPVSSPARLKQPGSRKAVGRFGSPDETVAMEQSPSPQLIQESFGGSLMMLQQGYRKVNPGKFLQLDKLSKQPSVPLVSPRSEISTPRLVKHMADRVKTVENRATAHSSKATQYGYRSRMNQLPESAAKRPSTVAEVVVSYIAQSNPIHKDTRLWGTTSEHKVSQLPYVQMDDFAERCVRCSEFPDIQIEGRSLSRILTNTNTLMAKEHCEILGADSCPDCIKTRSQKNHQDHCMRNTPAVANDVYKLALVHEKAPHLSMREVQRKVFDGEISDKVLPISSELPKLKIDSLIINHEPTEELMDDQTIVKAIPPEVYVATDRKPTRDGIKASKSFSKPPVILPFETIHETSEASSESEEDESRSGDEDEARGIAYHRHSVEQMQRIQVVSASELPTSIEMQSSLSGKCSGGSTSQEKVASTITAAVVGQDTSKVESHKASNTAPVSRSTTKGPKRPFTCDIVPSRDFFFDIADLAERLRTTEVTHRAERRKQRETVEEFFQALAANASPPNVANTDDNKAETGSVDSSDSMQRITEFNMAYEPPILFENKGRYLGVKAPPAGTTASSARISA